MHLMFSFNFILSLIIKENCIFSMHNLNHNKINKMIKLGHFNKTFS